MKMWAIIQNTFRESLEKKVLIAYVVLSTLVIVTLLLGLNFVEKESGKVAMGFFGNQAKDMSTMMEAMVKKLEVELVGRTVFPLVIFFSLFATCGAFPSLLAEGNIEMVLSKPIGRFNIVLAKFIGCVLIVFVNVAYFMIGLWLVLSLKTGVYNLGFLLAGLLIVFTYAVLMAVMALVGIVSKSPSLSLMAVFLIYVSSSILAHQNKFLRFVSKDFYRWIIQGAYYVLPKTSELVGQSKALVENGTINHWMPVWSSLVFGGVVLGIAGMIFGKRDY